MAKTRTETKTEQDGLRGVTPCYLLLVSRLLFPGVCGVSAADTHSTRRRAWRRGDTSLGTTGDGGDDDDEKEKKEKKKKIMRMMTKKRRKKKKMMMMKGR